MLVFICMVFALFAPELGAVKPASVPSDCVPFNYTMCKDILPYNLTRLPNYLKHHTTDAVAAALDNKEISILIQTNCSTDLAFFLCVLHFPICVQGFRGPVLPCRNLCNKVRQECTPTITRYGKKWPEEIHCGNFPVYEKGVCMKRISVHNTIPPRQPTKKGNCRCKTDKNLSWSFNRFDSRSYGFVITAQVIRILTTGNQWQITLSNINVFKESTRKGRKKMNTKSQTIFVDFSCPCPYLKNNHYFVIMGWYDLANNLVLTRKSFVYQIKRMKNMRKLKKLKHPTLKQFLRSLLTKNNKSSNKGNV